MSDAGARRWPAAMAPAAKTNTFWIEGAISENLSVSTEAGTGLREIKLGEVGENWRQSATFMAAPRCAGKHHIGSCDMIGAADRNYVLSCSRVVSGRWAAETYAVPACVTERYLQSSGMFLGQLIN